MLTTVNIKTLKPQQYNSKELFAQISTTNIDNKPAITIELFPNDFPV